MGRGRQTRAVVAAQPWLLAALPSADPGAFVHALSGQQRQRASQAPELGGGAVPGVVRRRDPRPEGQLQGGALTGLWVSAPRLAGTPGPPEVSPIQSPCFPDPSPLTFAFS